jgi:hypothetical protein
MARRSLQATPIRRINTEKYLWTANKGAGDGNRNRMTSLEGKDGSRVMQVMPRLVKTPLTPE